MKKIKQHITDHANKSVDGAVQTERATVSTKSGVKFNEAAVPPWPHCGMPKGCQKATSVCELAAPSHKHCPKSFRCAQISPKTT